MQKLEIVTNGEDFYKITDLIKENITIDNGICYLFIPHTSCAIVITEGYDINAIKDMSLFLTNLAPQNLPFITHKEEGPDDSPSHMKSLLLNYSGFVFIEDKKLLLGRWQEIYLAEFRKGPKTRSIYMKLIETD